MPRPLNRRQQRENARFLAALANTGNVRLVALVLGVNRSTYTKRRARDPAFAAAWAAALAAARAALDAEAGSAPGAAPAAGDAGMALVRRREGAVQLRRARPHQIGAADEAAYLQALEESPNKRRAARRAGFAHTSFERRVRRSPRFAARVEEALAAGWYRLLGAHYQAFDRLAGPQYGDDPAEWEERTADCPLPPMTADDAYRLLRYHEGAVLRAAGGKRRRR
jgi:hypothetical protein